MLTIPEIDKLLAEYNVQLGKFTGKRDAFASVLASIEKKVGEAKARISMKDRADDLLLTLQKRNHQKEVGMHEVLLSAIMHEVLPESGKGIILELEEKGGKPSLNIVASRGKNEKGEEKTESILFGSGGSVSNVVSAGLRFVALARTDARRFIVLDEPDCWLESDRIANFANVIGCMGRDNGVQSLMISHHSIALFEKSASSIQRLVLEDGNVIVKDVMVSQYPVLPHEIAEIRLKNIMSHKNTVIKFSSGMTAIIGPNDIGKSVVLTALHALSQGEFDKEFVTHDCESGTIEMVFGDGRSIECERFVKGSPAIVYRLWDKIDHKKGDKPAHEAGMGKEIPFWVDKLLGIRPYNGLDIQLGNQKRPIFLLDESAPKRASILSVGREYGILSTMQDKWKKWVTVDRQAIKAGELDASDLKIKLDALKNLPELTAHIERIEKIAKTVVQIDIEGKEMLLLCNAIAAREARVSELSNIPVLMVMNEIDEIDDLVEIAEKLTALENNVSVAIPALNVIPDSIEELSEAEFQLVNSIAAVEERVKTIVPELNSVPDEIEELSVVDFDLLNKLESVAEKIALSVDLTEINPISTNVFDENLDSLSEFITRITSANEKLFEQNEELKKVNGDIILNDNNLNKTIEDMGGVCPVCEQKIPHIHS